MTGGIPGPSTRPGLQIHNTTTVPPATPTGHVSGWPDAQPAVRITITPDASGFAARRAAIEIDDHLYGVPERALVTVDVGVLLHPDPEIIRRLRGIPAGCHVRYEGAWRAAVAWTAAHRGTLS